MSERSSSLLCFFVIALAPAVLVGGGCRGGTSETPPPAEQGAPQEATPSASPDVPDADAGAEPSKRPHEGMVDGVPWRFEHVEGREPADRIVIGAGDKAVIVVLDRNANDCFSTELMHGLWCEVERLAEGLIKYYPNLVETDPQ